METNVIYALVLTLIAGAATGLGALAALFAKRENKRLLSLSLGFSAGVMVYISMIEMFPQARACLCAASSERGYWYTVISFFAGVLIIGIIDWVVPSAEGDIGNLRHDRSGALRRMGLLTALAIAVHNFPEGMVTFTAAVRDPSLGIAICAAIAIHNIPEGIATAMPIYYSGKSRLRAFIVALLSGLAEPLGALIGYLLLRPILNDTVFGAVFAAIAGIMVFISVEELLPMARSYNKGRLTIIGFVIGMCVMALSLLLLAK